MSQPQPDSRSTNDTASCTSSPEAPPYLEPESNDLALNQSEALDEDVLSEGELRELYDTEEIQRFLLLFSTYVTEVHAPASPSAQQGSLPEEANSPENESYENLDEDDWKSLRDLQGSSARVSGATPLPQFRPYKCFSEEVAFRYIIPILPPQRPWPTFTLSRLRLAAERLYLATIPIYGPFLSQLHDLASWERPTTSTIYCMIFWTLWWYNLLAPIFVLRVLVSLTKRRIFAYPSLEELRRHRQQILEADEFGEQVSARLSMRASNVKEIWKFFKLYDHSTKKAKSSTQKASEQQSDTANDESDTTNLETVDDPEQVQDFKILGLHILEELADMHERVRNIFIWRRPSSSKKYGALLLLLFLLSFTPAKYIAKAAMFCMGFVFWHVFPVMQALSSSERKRIPPCFSDVPTDADYAMELISQRVASGLDTAPIRSQKRHVNSDSISSSDNDKKNSKGSPSQINNDKSIDWKKWGDRVATGKSAINDIKRLKQGKPWVVHGVWPPHLPIIPNAIGIAQTQTNVDVHTYPSQHGPTPGLLTLTQNSLIFTPLMSQSAKLIIPLAAIKGVKKAGLLKGLNIRWQEPVDGVKEQNEEKFAWIGNRDELFARLVGSDGRRWLSV